MAIRNVLHFIAFLSAWTYIISKGIDASRIESAVGYGESRLTNKCKNGVKCAEAEHFKKPKIRLYHHPEISFVEIISRGRPVMGRFFFFVLDFRFSDFQIAGFFRSCSRFPPLSLFVPHKGCRLQSGLGILL